MESEKTWLETIWEDRQKRLILGLCLLLAAGIIAVYAQTAGFDFADYDDPAYVKDNPKVPEGLTLSGIEWAFTAKYESNWIPLVWLSLMLDRNIFGTWAGGFHLVNVAFHIANTILLFWVLKRYSKSLWASFFVAALFALHPLHVESVAWVTERKDVLSTLFWMLIMLAYVRYVEIPTVKRYTIICVVFSLGLMTKSMLVTLPFVLLLMDYWPLRRLFPDFGEISQAEEARAGISIGRLIWEKTPLFILSAASCVVTFVAQKTGGAVMRLSTIPIEYRIGNALVSYCDYIVKTFRPIGLAVFYPHPAKDLAGWKVAVAVAVLMTITIVVILLRRRRYLLVGWLWYLGTLVPVIGIVQVGTQSMADRYTYLPLTGIFIMLVWLVGDIVAKWRYKAVLVGVAGSAIISTLGVMAFVQVSYWRDTMSLFTHAAAVTKDNYVAYSLIGARYAEKGDLDSAMRAFEIILKISPKDADTLYNVAKSLALRGKTEQALEFYNRVLAILPDDADTHAAIAMMEVDKGNVERAVELYKEGLSKKPDDGGLHGGLGSLYLQMGLVDEAVKELETAVELKADSAIYGNLAMAVLAKGDSDMAMAYLNKAIKLDPADAEAHYNLGNCYLSQDLPAKAVGEYEKAIKLKPKYVKAYGNLAVSYVRMGRADEAVANFRRVVELEPNSPDGRFNLANILAGTGKIDEALDQLLMTVELAPQDSVAHSAFAKLLLQQGWVERAIAEYERALDIDPNNESAQTGLEKALITQSAGGQPQQ
jgi:tetratricopeptide (TPR) repeat protein